MSPKHSNPTRPRRDQNREVRAHAPYNFVPLPEQVIAARPPIDHDRYADQALTGWIECEITTKAPTYVRGLVTDAYYRSAGQKSAETLTPEEKLEHAPFFGPGNDLVDGHPLPVIPGSTLRGLSRTLVEIAGYGRVRWVGGEPVFTFRAVAAANDDPLRAPYQDMLGKYGRDVKAGFLAQQGDEWYVVPARTPESAGLPSEKGSYLKIKERSIPANAIPGFVRFDSPDYHPGFYRVGFDTEERRGQRGNYVAITRIVALERGHHYQHEGVLVCAGNMKETTDTKPSPRKSHALLLFPSPRAREVKISPQAIDDYLAGLTPFQRKELWGGERGCLVDAGPVFYVERDGKVVAFGHSPNFRVPALLPDGSRAARPADFVPAEALGDATPDLADAIFGWVEEERGGPEGQRAGRVFFGDARFAGAGEDGVWVSPEPLTPHVLAGPKPTTFQHYLVQDRDAGHDPDNKVTLAHYGTSPQETQIRGHKLYWHKGTDPDIEATPSEREHEKQLTRIMPIRAGVRFRSTIHFENLRPEELGALLWVLALPGAEGKTYYHKLGMGKPLGMGAIAIKPQLWLTDRTARYDRLFAGNEWDTAAAETSLAPYLEAFEEYVLAALGRGAGRLRDIERIQMLLAMLEWHEGTDSWLETTRYMEIEHGFDKVNEYKERPVLPNPLAVAGTPVRETVLRSERPVVSRAGAVRETGVVKSFNERRGYGFITRDTGGEIFVHHSDIRGGAVLREGQHVRFTEGRGMKGRPAAKDVEAI